MKKLFTFLILFILLTFSASAGNIIRVRINGSTSNLGDSWGSAKDLISALSAATYGDEIWVAEGTYTPGSTRNSSFIVPTGVNIYGGFTEAEIADNSKTALTDYTRDRTKTTLSGEIGTPDPTDNTYHVVILRGGNTIDGFTIMGGYADNSETNPDQKSKGAGIIAYVATDVVISNNIIQDNTATSTGDYANTEGGGIYTDGTATITVDNNIITNNTVTANSENRYSGAYGGGVYTTLDMSKVIITNNSITNNKVTAYSSLYEPDAAGGGVYIRSENEITLYNNTISENDLKAKTDAVEVDYDPITNANNRISAFSYGAGVYTAYATIIKIDQNIISDNKSRAEGSNTNSYCNGAGIYVRGDDETITEIINNSINNNANQSVSPGGYASGVGSGICIQESNTATIKDNIIRENNSDVNLRDGVVAGGGIAIQEVKTTTINHNTIHYNASKITNSNGESMGGGIAISESETVMINNNSISNNIISGATTSILAEGFGGGVSIHKAKNVTINNSTITGNITDRAVGYAFYNGIYVDATDNVAIDNSIIWGNQGTSKQIGSNSSSFSVAYCLVEGGFSDGEHIINANPLFVDAYNGDFHLQQCSPAINSGDNTKAAGITSDLDGENRIKNGTIDLGAYESDYETCSVEQLTDLTITSGTLSPAFDPTRYDYTASVAYTVNTITIAATGSGVIDGLGTKSLNVGLNTFNITIGTTTYSVKVTRASQPVTPPAKSSDATLKSLTTSNGVLSPVFGPNIYSYTVEIKNDVRLSVNAVANDIKATVTGATEYNLKEGLNNINITVTAEDGTQQVYTIKVYRLGIEVGIENVSSNDVRIYPTLTTGKVYIESVSNNPTIELYSVTGKLLKKTQTTEVDLSTYSKGIYILRVGNKTVKVMKQ